MKKLYFLSAVLAAGLLTTACSSDDNLVEEVTPAEQQAAEDVDAKYPNGESYLRLALNLPATINSNFAAKTRAGGTENDQFDDGVDADYAVKEATLVLFEGDNETTATYVGTYELNLAWNDEGTPNNQITSLAPIVQKVAAPSNTTNNFYAYVVLNNKTQVSTLTASASATSTFSELFGTEVLGDADRTIDVDGTTSFIPMTNAPLAASQGSGATPANGSYSVLAQIDANRIYATMGEAAANPATSVYVERAYAKVSLITSQTQLVDASGTAITPAVSFSLKGWTLDRTAKSSYFQRNVADLSTWYNLTSTKSPAQSYRFIGNSAVGTSSKYRIYWATDPSYTATVATADASFTTAAGASDLTSTSGEALYCYENTFDLTNQVEAATTRALVALKFNDGKPFYTINDNYTALLGNNDETAADNALKQKIIDLLMANVTIKAKATTASLSAPTVADSEIDITKTTPEKVTVTVTKLSDGTNDLNFSTAENAIVTTMFNGTSSPETEPVNRIKYYEEGIAYYPVLIKHFGDSNTPWNAGDHVTGGAYEDAGTASPANYLGRYGLVRNNSYVLNVNKVTGIGSPTIPIPSTTITDDTAKSYIGVEINILSWAKRTQDVTL